MMTSLLFQSLPDAQSLVPLFGLTFSGVTFLTVITAAWKLSATLATFGSQLSTLMPLAEKFVLIERKVALMEKDMDNLWRAHREYCERKDRELEEWTGLLERLDRGREEAGAD